MASYDRAIKGEKKEDGKKKESFGRDVSIVIPETHSHIHDKKNKYT